MFSEEEQFSISYDEANQNSTLNHSDVDRPAFSPQLQPISTISQPDASHSQNQTRRAKTADFEQLSKEKKQAVEEVVLDHNVYKSLEEESQMKVKREILRAVQNQVMLAKAMVEAIFSRDVLSNGRVCEALQLHLGREVL